MARESNGQGHSKQTKADWWETSKDERKARKIPSIRRESEINLRGKGENESIYELIS